MKLIGELASELRSLGVSTGDMLMIHASLRAIGQTESGAEGVIQALEQAVGDGGTLLMVLGARDESAWVNELEESERASRLENSEPFDALRTPADPEVGVLAEVFRRRETTLVSNHPEGRFAASGFAASHLVATPPWDDYFGPGSALERLVQADGKLLRLGPDFDTTTLLHFAEYLTQLPNKRRVRRHRLVVSPAGPVVRVVESLDDEHGIVDYAGEDYFTDVLRAYLSTGRAQVGTVGNAASQLICSRDILQFAAAWMNVNLRPSF